MKHLGWWCAVGAGVCFLRGTTQAQTSLDVLQQDLDQIKQEHQDASSASYVKFESALEEASGSAEAALKLFQAAGGTMPPPTPVKTRYEHETPTEEAARRAKDASVQASFGSMAQLHCGMMRLAAIFVEKPDTPALKEDWAAWLKQAATIYPQLGGADTVKQMTMADSVVSKYLGFHGWGQKEQGQWSVQDVPKFYRTTVLDPLRAHQDASTLAAWDSYIAMKNADEPDADKWNQVDYPDLEFEKGSDDFAMEPSTEKIEALVTLLKANPTHPHFEDWLGRVKEMIAGLKASKANTAQAEAPMTNFVQPDAPGK
jgi:hypothetical protein